MPADLDAVRLRVLTDAPAFVELGLTCEDAGPGEDEDAGPGSTIGPVTVTSGTGRTHIRDGYPDREAMAQEVASLVQDFVIDEHGMPWPELVRNDGGTVGVLDVTVTEGAARWVGRGFSADVGRLREAVAAAGLRINEPWTA